MNEKNSNTPFQILKNWSKTQDGPLWFIFICLLLISAISMYSAIATITFNVGSSHQFFRHIGFEIGTFIVALFFASLGRKWFMGLLFISIFVSFLLVLMTTFGAGVTENEATRWISIMGIKFQPSELLKLGLAVFAARSFSHPKNINPRLTEKEKLMISIQDYEKAEKEKKQRIDKARMRSLLRYYFIGGLFVVMVMKENISTGLIMGTTMLLLGAIMGMPKKLYAILSLTIVFMVATLSIAMIVSPKFTNNPIFKRLETAKARILRRKEKNDSLYYKVTDSNLQKQHAKMAIANGGLMPRGPGNSIQRDILPQAYSDYIFAIILEEYGVYGFFIVILLYLSLVFRIWKIGKKLDGQRYYTTLIYSITILYTLQALINMAVAVDAIPVTGQPLPLISRGGTSLFITGACFGVLLGVAKYAKEDELNRQLALQQETEDISDLVDEECEDSEEIRQDYLEESELEPEVESEVCSEHNDVTP